MNDAVMCTKKSNILACFKISSLLKEAITWAPIILNTAVRALLILNLLLGIFSDNA